MTTPDQKLNVDLQGFEGKPEPNPEWEAKAKALREHSRAEAAKLEPDETDQPEMTLKMLERWTPDAEPANEHGQITFSRAMLESAEDSLRLVITQRNELVEALKLADGRLAMLMRAEQAGRRHVDSGDARRNQARPRR